MSYTAQEQSTEGAAPIELYKITGADSFYYTSSSTEFTYEGDTYEPIVISRTAPTINNKETSGNITVRFPFNNEFVRRYLGGVPPSPDRVDIYRAHLSDSTAEVQTFWAGFVTGVKFKGTEAVVSLSGLSSRMSAQIPSKTFSWMCNHILYGEGCRVAESSHTFEFNITAVSTDGITLTVTDNGRASTEIAADASFFNGGTIRTGVEGSQRMALSVTDASTPNTYEIVLMVPVSGLEVGQGISLSAGCDHSVQTCRSRFNNVERYGGFPFVPTLNPFVIDNKHRSANR